MKIINGVSLQAGLFQGDEGETYLRLVNPALNEGTWCRVVVEGDEASFVQIPLSESKKLTKAAFEYLQKNEH